MIRISTTTLEAFRRVIETEYGSEAELIAQVKGVPFKPSWQMNAGTAWHACLEGNGQAFRPAMCESKTKKGNCYKSKNEAADIAESVRLRTGSPVEHFQCTTCGQWHVGKPTGKESESGRLRSGEYNFDREDVSAARQQIGPGLWEVKETRLFEVNRVPVTVVAKCDHIFGAALQDNKTKFSPIDVRDYEPSLQWRFYLEIFGASFLRYNLFSFKEPKDGYCAFKDFSTFKFWPYVGMESDCQRWLSRFIEWADGRGLMSYLHRESRAA